MRWSTRSPLHGNMPLRAEAAHRPLSGLRLYFIHTNPAYLLGLRLPMLLALVRVGCKVTAFAPGIDRDQIATLEGMGIDARGIDIRATGMNPARDLVDMARMVRLFTKEKPDIVFCNNIKPVVFGTIAAAIAGVRKRHALVGGLGYAFTTMPDSRTGSARRAARYVASVLYAIAFRLASTVIFHNADDADLMVATRICPRGKASVVPGSGVDTDEFSPAEPVDGASFVFVGRMLADKGVREFLEASRLVRRVYPEARFTLVGEADSNPSAIPAGEIERHLDSGDVRWVGKVSNVRPYLHGASVFVLPSYREGLPRSTLEAMACGLAIVTTDAPGCRDTVVDGLNGTLVPVGDAAALAQAMMAFCEKPGIARQMGQESRRLAVERFSCHAVNDAILSLLQEEACE